MVPATLFALAAGIVLPVALALGGSQAGHAQGVGPAHERTHLSPVKGVVTDMGNGRLQVQTQNGAVTVTLTTATRVFRLMTGSTADLKTGQFISLTVTTGTNIVQQLVIAPPTGATPHTAHKPPHPKIYDRPPAAKTRPWTGKMPVHGQIMAMNGNTLTVRLSRGQMATLTVNDSTQILKVMRGALSDLDIGQTVVVLRDSTGAAEEVEIVSS